MNRNDSGPPPTRRGRPATTSTKTIRTPGHEEADHGDDIAVELRRRARAALRCEPLPWRVNTFGSSGLHARDAMIPAQRTTSPSTYGMTPAELRVEAHRLRRAGWSPEEIHVVLEVGVLPV